MNQHTLNFLNLLTKHSVWFSWSTGPFSTDDPTVGVVVLRNPFFTLVPFRLINTEKVSLSCGVSVELLTCILWGFLIVPCPVACLGKVDDRSASGGRMGCVLQCAFVPLLFMPPSSVLSTLPGSAAFTDQECHPAFSRGGADKPSNGGEGVYWCVVSDQAAVRKYP